VTHLWAKAPSFMCSEPLLRRHTRFRADSSSGHQLSPHQEQIAAPEQRKQLSPVLGEAKVVARSKRGNCHENAFAKSFFQLLKRERIRRRMYLTRDAARQDVFDYIEMFYNPNRKHTNNGMLSPVEYEITQRKK